MSAELAFDDVAALARATIAALRSESPPGRRAGPESLPVAAGRTVGARPADRG
jgi:hypothetical protein